MTSTNDGKEVKSNQTSGAKVKSFYIELYRSLEAGLSKDSDLPERTRNLCEAWRRVHSLCAHSAASTHPHLLSWLQRHTARTVLQTEWQQPENKNEHKRLEEAINDFIKQSQQSSSAGQPPWQTQLVARGEWFKRILANPWGHPVLRVLLDSTRKQSPKDEEILEWLKEERGVMFVTRLRQLASSKDCKDLALELASSILDRVRACSPPPRDDQPDDIKEMPTGTSGPTFEDILKTEAGFTNEVMDLLTDIEFVLLHKRNQHPRCIELAKLISLRNGYLAVERLQSRLESSPREKKLWKNAKDVATLIAQVVITRCMVVPLCAGASCVALRRSARALSRLVPRSRLPAVAAALAAPAATARHLHTLTVAVEAERKDDMKPFVCELYVRAITAGMNELERLKLKSDKESEARSYEQTLSQWFVQLGALLAASERVRCECNLTAFSVHATPAMYGAIQAAPALPPVALDIEPESEIATSEFGSWASDSRSQTNLVKTSETLNLKQRQHQTNVLSTAILSEGEALELSPDLCQDITVLLSGPRVKTLSWDMDRELLLENCRAYMERTKFGTQAVTTELKYLNLDPRHYQHLPEEDEDDSDMFYGIEKGYEHLVEFQEPEEIWQDANDPDRTESGHTTDLEIEEALAKSKSRKKGKKIVSSEDEDPLSSVAEAKRIEKKKERPHSKERSKERKPKTKTKLKEKDPLALEDVTDIKLENQSTGRNSDHSVERKKDSAEKKKEGGGKKKDSNKTQDHSVERKKESKIKEKKEKKERKLKEKIVLPQTQSSSLSSLIGMKVTNLVDRKPATSTTTDSDYDSQGKYSINSLLSEGNETDVIFDGLFSMDELKSPEKVPDRNDKMGVMRNNEVHIANGAIKVVGSDTNRTPTSSNSKTNAMIPDDVKNSISRLIQFRRAQKYSNKNKQSQDSGHLADNLKTYIKKPVSGHQTELRNDVNNYLNNKEVSPRPVLQYNQNPKPILFNNSPPTGVKILNAAQHSPLPKPSTSREVKTNKKTVEMLNRQNPSQAELQLRKEESKIFHDFLKDLQASINAGAGGKGASPPKKDIKSMNRVNPVVPKSEPKVSPSAKQTVKKSEVAPNTFSRLSYYKNKNDIKTKQIIDAVIDHQSKQLESQLNVPDLDQLLNEHRSSKLKYLQTIDTVIKPPRPSENAQKVIKKSSSASREHPLMSSLLQTSPNLPKTQVVHNDRPWDISSSKTGRLPSSSEKEQQDLMLLLRQQSKQNLIRTKPETPKDRMLPPPTKTSTGNLLPPPTKTSTGNIPSSKKINIIDCKSVIINPSLSKVNTSTKSDEVRSTAKSKVRNEAHTKKTEQTHTSVSKIVKDGLDSDARNVKIKTNAKHADPDKQTDWESVMDALLKHKTPSRGPNALDMALNKDASYMGAFENSLRNQRIVKPPSSCSETIEPTKDTPTIRSQPVIDNMHSPNILRRLNTDSKGNKHKITKQASKGQKVLTNSSSNSSSLSKSQHPDGIPILASEQKKINVDSRPKATASMLKKVHTEPKKPQFTCQFPKEDDPFISGNLNSDYDLLEDLIDDELRKEIGESLLSDEDSYSSIQGLKDPKAFISVNKNTTSVIQANKQSLPSQLIQTVSTRQTLKKPCNNASKPAPNLTIPVQPTTGYVNVNTVTSTQYAKLQTLPTIQTTNIIHQIPKSVIVPPMNEQTFVNTVTSIEQTYVAVPQPTALQNVVLIGSELVYQPCVQTPYVTFNSQPNIAVYQTTQFAAPVVNPLIIGNAITTPSAPLAVSERNVAASTVSKVPETITTVVEELPKSDVKIDVKKSLNPDDTIKEKCDINSNKNCERKVLSEVQEKRSRRPSFEHDVKETTDQDRLKKKRMAILNRKIYHRSDNKAIPLTYSPLKNMKTETKIQENQHHLRNTAEMKEKVNDASIKLESLINTKVKTLIPEQVEVNEKDVNEKDANEKDANEKDANENCNTKVKTLKPEQVEVNEKDANEYCNTKVKTLKPKQVEVNEKDANENCKENKNEDKTQSCRRILLRSCNKLNTALVEEVKIAKDPPRKTKVRLKVASESAKPEEIKSEIKNTKPVKRALKKTLNKTIKKVVIKKRITRQTKKNIKINSEVGEKADNVVISFEEKNAVIGEENVSSVATDETTNVNKETIVAENVPKLMDVEDQILGSKILKTANPDTLTDVTDILNELEGKENSEDITSDVYDNSVGHSSPVSSITSPQPQQNEFDTSKCDNVIIKEKSKETDLDVISKEPTQLTNKNTDCDVQNETNMTNIKADNLQAPQNLHKEVMLTSNVTEPMITDNIIVAPQLVGKDNTENIDNPVKKAEEEKSTPESKATQDEKKSQDEADVICLDNYDDEKSQTFGIDNVENIPKAFLDAITVEDLPTYDPKNPLKKCVRIKLPNGRAFKATVRGQSNIDVETLFADPGLKSVILSNISNKNRYTLNIKQISTSAKSQPGKILETKIQEIVVHRPKTPTDKIETIDLLSEDEDDEKYGYVYFETEFGRYKVPAMNEKLHKSHQKIFDKKCVLKLQVLKGTKITKESIPSNATATTKQIIVPDAMTREPKPVTEDLNTLKTSKDMMFPNVTPSPSLAPIIKDTTKETINSDVITPKVVSEHVAPKIIDTVKQIENPNVVTPKSIPVSVASDTTKENTISDVIMLKSVPVNVLPSIKDVTPKSIPASVNSESIKQIDINVETPKSVPTSVIPNVKDTKENNSTNTKTPKSKQVRNPEVIPPKFVPTSVLLNIDRNPDEIASASVVSDSTEQLKNSIVTTLNPVSASVAPIITRDTSKQISKPDVRTLKSIPPSVVSGTTESIQLPEGINLKSVSESVPKISTLTKQLINSLPKGTIVSTPRPTEPEVIEIDDSSNDDLSGDDSPETRKSVTTEKTCEDKILEFKNLLLKDLGVQETDNDSFKPDNPNTVEETSVDFIIPDTGADVFEHFSEIIVPDSVIPELIIPDNLRSEESNSKNAQKHYGLNPCFVKLTNCDDLVERFNNYKLLKPCSIALVRCDDFIPETAPNPDLSKDFEEPISSPVDFNTECFDDNDMDVTPKTLSRSGSFSILNDYILLDLPPLSEELKRTTSPVMEAFESIAALHNRPREEIMEKPEQGSCEADWLLCKSRIHLLNNCLFEDVDDDQESEILKPSVASSTNLNMSEVHTICAPSLVKILTKFFQDNRMLESYNPIYKEILSSHASPTHNLKRKYLDKFQNFDKISKRSKGTSSEESNIAVQVITEAVENSGHFEEVIKVNLDDVFEKKKSPYENVLQVTEPTDGNVVSIKETTINMSKIDKNVTATQLDTDIMHNSNLVCIANEEQLKYNNDSILNEPDMMKTDKENLNKETNISETAEICESTSLNFHIDKIITTSYSTTTKHTRMKSTDFAIQPESVNGDEGSITSVISHEILLEKESLESPEPQHQTNEEIIVKSKLSEVLEPGLTEDQFIQASTEEPLQNFNIASDLDTVSSTDDLNRVDSSTNNTQDKSEHKVETKDEIEKIYAFSTVEDSNNAVDYSIIQEAHSTEMDICVKDSDTDIQVEADTLPKFRLSAVEVDFDDKIENFTPNELKTTTTKEIKYETGNKSSDYLISSSNESKFQDPAHSTVIDEQRNEGDPGTNIDVFNNITSKLKEIFGPTIKDENRCEISDLLEEHNKKMTKPCDFIDHEYTLRDASERKEHLSDKGEKNEPTYSCDNIHIDTIIVSNNFSDAENALIEDVVDMRSDELLEEELAHIVLGHGASESNEEKCDAKTTGNENSKNDLLQILESEVQATSMEEDFTEDEEKAEALKEQNLECNEDKIIDTNSIIIGETCALLQDIPKSLVTDIVEIHDKDELELELARIVLGSSDSADSKQQILIIDTENLGYDEVKVCCIQQSELKKIVESDNKDINPNLDMIEYKTARRSSSTLQDYVDFTQSTEDILQITQEIDEYGNVKEIDIKLNVPKTTYSRKSIMGSFNYQTLRGLKRKSDMPDARAPEKKYRKGKNIDTPKLTKATILESTYAKEFNRLFNYCSSVKFSYSRPFHKEYIDIDKTLRLWPSGKICDVETDSEINENLFTDSEIVPIALRDPLHLTLAQEIVAEYNESDYSPSSATETNFQMGFGEGSGRVIQNSEDDGGLKFSAATLSDVKQTQPLLLSENYDKCNSVPDINIDATKQEIEALQRSYKCIQIRDKVRSFFKKTMVELSNDWNKQNKKQEIYSSRYYSKADKSSFPFGLNLPDFINPPPVEVVIQVVQVGQLPVSAAAQNPVTCDPRVTQVSDASPSQCSADNDANDDPHSDIKTEYTELTTANINLPLQDYAQHHSQFSVESQNNSNIIMHHDFIIEEIKEEIKEEIEEEPEINDEIRDNFETVIATNEPSPGENNIIDNNVEYTYETSPSPQAQTPTLVEANMDIMYSALDTNPQSQVTQQNQPAQLAQQNQTPPLARQNQPAQLAQQNQPPQLAQQNQPAQLAHPNQPTQLAQQNQTAQLAQQNHPPQLAKQNQQPQLAQQNQPAQLAQQNQPGQLAQRNKTAQLAKQNQIVEPNQRALNSKQKRQEKRQKAKQKQQAAKAAQQSFPTQHPQQKQQAKVSPPNQQIQFVNQSQQPRAKVQIPQPNQKVLVTQQNQQVHAQQNQQQLLHSQQNQQAPVAQQNSKTHLPQQSPQGQVQLQNSQQPQQNSQEQQNSSPEKTDQIAHAMSAAGISTSSENLANTRAHALVNILSQKFRQGAVGASSTNAFPKTTQINAMALQQALAQILPPPLNQTNGTENNQQTTPNTQQVLHIVQGKNASGNQLTLLDNGQPSVINTPNATPVLHIVQNKANSSGPTANGTPATQANSFSGLSLVDGGLQQGNQLLHIVNAGNQKNANAGQLLRKVNLLTNLANVQGSNEQKMVQFVCKSADGKSIQLNSQHPRGMVLRLQPVETPSLQLSQSKPVDSQDLSPAPSTPNNVPNKETGASQQEIKSRSVYEENYAKFIQSSNKPTVPEKATSLPKFGQAFGKQVFQDGQKNDINNSNSHISTSSETPDCQPNDNAISLEHMSQISSPPLLLRKSPQTSQSQTNLVQQLKQTISPMNMSMHGGVIYTRQIPVNIGGGQTINLITVPSTDLIDDSTPKHQTNQDGIEQSIIKIVPQTPASSSETTEENNPHLNVSNETTHTPQPQQVLTQMRIKLPMLSKTPQMVGGTRLVRPSFFQIQRNVISGTNQPVYQQLVLTAAPPLGQQTIRLPQAQTSRHIKVPSESQSSSESQMSSSTLEQLREFDLVLEQVKERSTGSTGNGQPNASPSSSSTTFSKIHTASSDTTDSPPAVSAAPAETKQQVLYSISNSQPLNVTYVNRKTPSTTTTTSSFARSPDSSGIVESPTSSTHQQIPHTVTSDTAASSDTPTTQANTTTHPTPSTHTTQPKPAKSKPKSRPKASSNPPNTLKLPTVPPKTSTQKPAEDEQTTQRILYILAEYKEQVENSPDKDKPAPRRRTNPPSNPGGSSKRKKSSSGSRRSGRDMSPCHGEDTCRTMGSEDSSCGTSQGDCNESCIDSHSPQDSPRKVVRKLTYEQETPPPVTQPRPQPQRNVIVADGQTITVARGTAGKPTTAVLMPANYILPVSMVKGGQQIAIVTNRGPKLLTVGGGEGGATNALLLQRLIGPAGLKPVLTRPGVRHVRLPTSALHNLHAFNLATTTIHPPDSTASQVPAPTPPDLVDTRASSSPWRTERESRNVKPERGSSPEGSEPWHLPPSEYCYEETVRSEQMDRTVLDPIPDRYSPDMEAQRIFDKMFDVDSKKSYMVDSHDDSPRCGYDIDASDCDDKAYHQVVHKKDGSSHRQHRLTHVSAAALRHKYAILEHELRLQKSLSEECEDLGVDSPSASELFPEAELLFAASPAHDHTQDHGHHSHTPQPILSQSGIPQPDLDDQMATDHILPRSEHIHDDRDLGLGLEDVGIVTVSEDGMQATIQLDQEEFARSHPNTTFHSEPTDDGEVQQPFTLSGLKGRHITSTIFHSTRPQGTVLMTAPQTTVISQATAESSGVHHSAIKYSDIDNMINSLPGAHTNNMHLSSVLVKDDGLSRFDNLLHDSRELHLSNTTSAIVHSSAHTTQVIRRVCYEEDKRERDNRYLMDEPDGLIAGDDAKMMGGDSSREATFESVGGDTGSSPERHTELFWDSHSASGRADFSSDSDKCCKSPSDDTSTDSSAHAHMRLDSVIKEARGVASDEDGPPLRTYPAPRSLSGKTAPSTAGARRRASGRGVVKRGTCLCCVGEPAPPRPKKPRQRRQPLDFAAAN